TCVNASTGRTSRLTTALATWPPSELGRPPPEQPNRPDRLKDVAAPAARTGDPGNAAWRVEGNNRHELCPRGRGHLLLNSRRTGRRPGDPARGGGDGAALAVRNRSARRRRGLPPRRLLLRGLLLLRRHLRVRGANER